MGRLHWSCRGRIPRRASRTAGVAWPTYLATAEALREQGTEVTIRFEGAGVLWLKRFDLRDDRFTQHYGERFDRVKDLIGGSCDFCTRVRFDVLQHAESLEVPLVGGERQHGTVADLVAGGWQVIVY